MSSHGRHEVEEEEDADRWLITYADMITLLMAFFIMLYSMSVVDLQKFEALTHAMGNAFGTGAPDPTSQRSAEARLLDGGENLMARGTVSVANRATLVNGITGEINASLPQRLRESVEVTHSAGTVTIRMKADGITFPAGQATLTGDARQILDCVGPALSEAGATTLVEGHTCDLPINTARFASNWELSAQRAGNVMVYLIRSAGVRPERISAAGFADTRPLAPNSSQAGRRRNRRVDIVVLGGDRLERAVPRAARGARQAASDAGRVGTMALQPVRLCPPIDLEAHYRKRTGGEPDTTPRGH